MTAIANAVKTIAAMLVQTGNQLEREALQMALVALDNLGEKGIKRVPDFRTLLTRIGPDGRYQRFARLVVGSLAISIQGHEGAYSEPRSTVPAMAYSKMEIAMFEKDESVEPDMHGERWRWLQPWKDDRFKDVTSEDDWDGLIEHSVAPYLEVEKIQLIYERMLELDSKPKPEAKPEAPAPAQPTVPAKWYMFSQNNSRGHFTPPGIHVYVLAVSKEHAISKLEEQPGFTRSYCSCCGSRWYEPRLVTDEAELKALNAGEKPKCDDYISESEDLENNIQAVCVIR
jgi:hypothetical protein